MSKKDNPQKYSFSLRQGNVVVTVHAETPKEALEKANDSLHYFDSEDLPAPDPFIHVTIDLKEFKRHHIVEKWAI